MKSVQETWGLLDRIITPMPPELTDLELALGRVLREDAQADADQPPFSRSAMDGYLVRLDEQSSTLRISGEVTPGAPARIPAAGSALRIFTGSAVPETGAAVVMQEDADRSGDTVILRTSPGAEHIRQRGTHARRNDVLVPAGTRLMPGHIALLALSGIARPLVSPVVRVAHIATGSEMVGYDEVPREAQIRDTNSPMISALLQESHAERRFHCRIDESPTALESAIGAALEEGVHLLLVSGGASVGEHDHTRKVLIETGFELLVEGINSRPGKPLIVARKDGLIAFGLPGNPLSHFVCYHLFVHRAIARLTGGTPCALVGAKAADVSIARPRVGERWIPCRVICENATVAVQALPSQDSSDLTVLAQARGLLRVPAEGFENHEAGEFLPTGEF